MSQWEIEDDITIKSQPESALNVVNSGPSDSVGELKTISAPSAEAIYAETHILVCTEADHFGSSNSSKTENPKDFACMSSRMVGIEWVNVAMIESQVLIDPTTCGALHGWLQRSQLAGISLLRSGGRVIFEWHSLHSSDTALMSSSPTIIRRSTVMRPS